MQDNTLENEHNLLTENEQVQQRKSKLNALRQKGNAYPNDFKRDTLAQDLFSHYANKEASELEALAINVSVAGRIMTRRVMGKASFMHLQDMSGRIQLYIRQNDLPEEAYEAFKHWDLGDIIGAEGKVFKTKTGELSLHVSSMQFLTKALRPLPDKFHGLVDQETKFRQRYLDLMMNERTRRVFQIRSHVMSYIRQFLSDKGFLEVETPMMHPIAGGAAARPFVTHHNALDRSLFLRIAPELYLKRLVVGGFEKVFEINRNFRNEGLSTRHNPEFTMLEFYQAFATYHDLMNLTEALLRGLSETVLGTSKVNYQGIEIDFAKPFQRMTLKESIMAYNPDITERDLDDIECARKLANQLGLQVESSYGLGKIQCDIFEKTVEKKIEIPTFITEYPVEVSPLARANSQNPFVTDRFELFAGRQEIANGFSELNDPEDQAERFRQQVQEREAGDLEAMSYDEDYVKALEYGLPPTAGEGIGIDRLVMLLVDSPSIRDVILFPILKDE